MPGMPLVIKSTVKCYRKACSGAGRVEARIATCDGKEMTGQWDIASSDIDVELEAVIEDSLLGRNTRVSWETADRAKTTAVTLGIASSVGGWDLALLVDTVESVISAQ